MAMQEIPFDSANPHFAQVVELDGQQYRMRVCYNQRADRYVLDMALADGTPFVAGMRIIPERDLLRRYIYHSAHPGGALFCKLLDVTSDAAPAFGELGPGKRCTLWYIPVDDLVTGTPL